MIYGKDTVRAALRSIFAPLILSCYCSVPGAVEILDVSGSVGYTYRALLETTDRDTTSNQVRGALNARSYLWQPWFATADAGVTFTRDSTDYDNRSAANDTTIVTGDLNLSVLPRSRTPFQLSYQASDSRVDVYSEQSALTTLGSKEFESRRLSLTQSLYTEAGNRFQARYDTNRWAARDGDTLEDERFGVEAAVRTAQQSVTAKGSYQTTDRSVLDQHSQTSILNIDHFYYPSRALRVDSMASLYDSEGKSALPSSSTTDLAQLSSFVFWRPVDRPLTVSGGLRLYDLSGAAAGNSTDLASYSAMGGLFYQITRNLRVDASVDFATNDNQAERTSSARERAGALYQSDVREVFAGLTYQWHASGAVRNQSAEEQDIRGLAAQLGHEAQRLWMREAATLRLSLSQSLGAEQQAGDADTATERLDHSASLSWDRRSGAATTLLQMTLADARMFGDQDNNQQFANFQALRQQNLSRRSSLAGNLTAQWVRQDFNGSGDGDTVTATGQISYRNSDIFGVPRLRFLSDLRLSRAATDAGVDRAEWENRLDYAIGMLDTSLSWRQIDLSGEEDFSLIYFQVTRRF